MTNLEFAQSEFLIIIPLPIGSMYAIYGNICHQYTPHVSIYTIHGSYGLVKKTHIWGLYIGTTFWICAILSKSQELFNPEIWNDEGPVMEKIRLQTCANNRCHDSDNLGGTITHVVNPRKVAKWGGFIAPYCFTILFTTLVEMNFS